MLKIRTVFKIGNVYAVSIPKRFVDEMGIVKGDFVSVDKKENKLVLELLNFKDNKGEN